MRIGIDISQIAYTKTGVANYLSNLVSELVKSNKHEYVLFFSSLRRELPADFQRKVDRPNVQIKKFKLPLMLLDLMWNKFHRVSIENFIGNIDVFISSDWTEPPARRTKKITIIYDLIIYKHPKETDQKIISVQTRKLNWVKKESNLIFCISESGKNDVVNLLGIEEKKVKVIYPGL